MMDFKTDIVVIETRGLLREAERKIHHAMYDLAFDNLTTLPEELIYVKQLLDIIDEKVENYKNSLPEEDDDALI